MTFDREIRGEQLKERAEDKGLSQQVFGSDARENLQSGSRSEQDAPIGALPALNIESTTVSQTTSFSERRPDNSAQRDESQRPPGNPDRELSVEEMLPGKTPKDEKNKPSLAEQLQDPTMLRPEFPGPRQHETSEVRDEKVVAENRAAYKQEVEKQVASSAVSLPAEKGESYAHVLHRMYPKLTKDELVALTAEVKQQNGGKELQAGDRFAVMNKEQQLRQVDQTMNEYDARHKTDALDLYGDFAAEKGKMAGIHNSMRAAQKENMQAGLDKFEKNLPSDLKASEPPPARRPEKVNLIDFGKEAQALFPKLDMNHDNNLTHSELVDASNSKQLSGKELQVVSGLLAGEEDIKDLHNDRLGKERGISIRDLQKLDDVISKLRGDYRGAVQSTLTFANERVFDSIDINGDGLMSKKEMKDALQNRDDLRRGQRAALRYDLENASKIMEISNDELGDENSGISKEDLKGLLKHVSESENAEKVEKIARAMKAMRAQQSRQSDQRAV